MATLRWTAHRALRAAPVSAEPIDSLRTVCRGRARAGRDAVLTGSHRASSGAWRSRAGANRAVVLKACDRARSLVCVRSRRLTSDASTAVPTYAMSQCPCTTALIAAFLDRETARRSSWSHRSRTRRPRSGRGVIRKSQQGGSDRRLSRSPPGRGPRRCGHAQTGDASIGSCDALERSSALRGVERSKFADASADAVDPAGSHAAGRFAASSTLRLVETT